MLIFTAKVYIYTLLVFLLFQAIVYSARNSFKRLNKNLYTGYICLSYQHSDPACVNSVINEELRKVDVWLRANKLFINYSKTKFLLFNNTSKKCNFKVNINGFNIEQSKSIKYLGVVLDEKLN